MLTVVKILRCRFNKAQQDSFLPHVESGTITLIGATTENPSFSLNSALLSRCRVIVLSKLAPEAIKTILDKAVIENNSNVKVEEEAVEFLSNAADGDARTALNCLQIAMDSAAAAGASYSSSTTTSSSTSTSVVTLAKVKEGLKRAHTLYDRKGDEHFHCASALQKSIRGSNDSAALYWCARMLNGGEDPLFVARRLVRMAAEDVGLADPKALPLAVSAMQGCQLIGKPECFLLLAEAAVYLARAPKSHEVYGTFSKVMAMLKEGEGNLPGVPLHLRNANTKLDKQMGYGNGYSFDLSKVKDIEYMPEGLEGVNLFKK